MDDIKVAKASIAVRTLLVLVAWGSSWMVNAPVMHGMVELSTLWRFAVVIVLVIFSCRRSHLLFLESLGSRFVVSSL